MPSAERAMERSIFPPGMELVARSSGVDASAPLPLWQFLGTDAPSRYFLSFLALMREAMTVTKMVPRMTMREAPVPGSGISVRMS